LTTHIQSHLIHEAGKFHILALKAEGEKKYEEESDMKVKESEREVHLPVGDSRRKLT